MLQERDLPEHYRVWRREDGLRELVPGPLYKATDLRTNSIVVLRFFEGVMVEPLARRTALLLEATSPWIAALRDAFTKDDTLVTSTDFIVGETLAERVARRGPLPAATVWEAAVQGAEALAALHARGVRHGDLGPSSLLFPDNPGDDGLVKLVGCGLPRGGKEAAPAEDTGLPDDFRRLGVCLWFALTGSFPFGGDPAALGDGSAKADALLAAFAVLLCGEPDRQPGVSRALLEALKAPQPASARVRAVTAETLPGTLPGPPLPGTPVPAPGDRGGEPTAHLTAADLAIPLPPDRNGTDGEAIPTVDAGASPLVIPPPSVVMPGQRDPRRDKPSPDSPPPPVPARKAPAPEAAPKKRGFGWL